MLAIALEAKIFTMTKPLYISNCAIYMTSCERNSQVVRNIILPLLTCLIQSFVQIKDKLTNYKRTDKLQRITLRLLSKYEVMLFSSIGFILLRNILSSIEIHVFEN